MRHNAFTRLPLQVLLTCALISLSGLLGSSTERAFAQGMSYVRIIHASPDIGTADVFVEGSSLLTNFEFGTVTNYVQIPPGTHSVQVSLIGRGVNAALINQKLTVEPGIAYTVAAVGTKSTGFSLLAFADNNRITPGQSQVRIYHLSPGTNAASVSANESTLVNNLAYKQASNYFNIPAGPYTFNIAIAQTNTALSVSTDVTANTVTSVFALGLLNGVPKIRLVTAQAQGVPGLPGTGSDPKHASRPSPSVARAEVAPHPQHLLVKHISTNPVRLIIPAIRVNALIESVGVLPNGDLATPEKDPWNDTGWYEFGPRPGETGSAVIDGHLDRPGGDQAVFWWLQSLHVKDLVMVVDAQGLITRFRVTSIARYAPQQAPLQDIFGNNNGVFLNLITCAGDWIPSQHQTTQRLVVYTTRV